MIFSICPKHGAILACLFFLLDKFVCQATFIPSGSEDLPRLFSSLQRIRAEPWPVTAHDCAPFPEWTAKRKAFRNGSLERLGAAHRVFELFASGVDFDEIKLESPALSEDELQCLRYWSDRVSLSEWNISQMDLSCRTLEDFTVTRMKLKHDIDQLAYLLVKGRLPPCFYEVLQGFVNVYGTLNNEKEWEHKIRILAIQSFNQIGLFYNTLLYLPAVPSLSNVVNPLFDFALARQTYYGRSPHFVVADNVLTHTALDALRTTAHESTVWFDMKDAYVGAYVHQGLANQVLMQLTHELRIGFPDIIGDLELLDLWAYKYEQGNRGIQMHADGALVNVNLWITPDSANNNETSGGMVVYLKRPPADVDNWSFNRMANTSLRAEFVQDAPSVTVPYRCNRVVIFESSLVHYTDKHDFKPGYDSRRINFTLLFGRLPKFFQ